MSLLPTHANVHGGDVNSGVPSAPSARSDSGLSFQDEKASGAVSHFSQDRFGLCNTCGCLADGLLQSMDGKDVPITTTRPAGRVNLKAAAISELPGREPFS